MYICLVAFQTIVLLCISRVQQSALCKTQHQKQKLKAFGGFCIKSIPPALWFHQTWLAGKSPTRWGPSWLAKLVYKSNNYSFCW